MTKGIDRQFWFDSTAEMANVMRFIEGFFQRKRYKYGEDQLADMQANVITSVYQAGVNAKERFLNNELSKAIDGYSVLQSTFDYKLKYYVIASCVNELKNYAKSNDEFRAKTKSELEQSSETKTVQLVHEQYSSLESGFDDDGSAFFIASSTYRQPEREVIAEDLFIKVNSIVEMVLKSYKDEKQRQYLHDYFWYKADLLGLTLDELATAGDLPIDPTKMLRRRFKEKLSNAITEILGIRVDSEEIDELEGSIKSIAHYFDLENLELPDLSDDDETDNDATGTDK